VNLADLALGIILLGTVVTGLRRGLVGMALYSLASILSLLAAVALTLAAAATPIPDTWLLVLVPIVFCTTLGFVLALSRPIAAQVTSTWLKLPFAPADRLLGAALAGGLGVLLLSLTIIVLLEFKGPLRRVTDELAQSEAAPLILAAGARELGYLAGPIPILAPLAERLTATRQDILGQRARPTAEEL
jgi:lysylphosphatidylglycerol synthetase-like protein (DUF2156 family)